MKKEKLTKIKKHSAIIQADSTSLSYYSKKLWNGVIYIIREQLQIEPEREWFEFRLADIKRISGINDTNNKRVKDALRALVNTSIEFNLLGKDKDDERWIVSSLIAEAQYIVEGKPSKNGINGKHGLYRVFLSPTIRESVAHPSLYSSLDLILMRRLKTKHALGMYEMLKDYQAGDKWHGKIEIVIDDFKRVVGIEPDSYESYSMLNKRVLKPSINQINELMDITVSYQPIKVGRRYKSIAFSIKKKQKNEESTKHEYGILVNRLLLTPSQAKKVEQRYVEHQELLEHRIANIENKYKKGKIENIGGYALRYLMDGSLDDPIALEKKEKKSQTRNHEKQKELIDLEEKKRLDILKKRAEDWYLSCSEEERKTLIKDYEDSLSSIMLKSYKARGGIDSPIFYRSFLVFITEKTTILGSNSS